MGPRITSTTSKGGFASLPSFSIKFFVPACLVSDRKPLNWADVFFMVPGIFLLIANGDVLSEQWGGIFHVSWIVVSLVLFALSGMVWVGILLRYQNRLITLSESRHVEKDPSEFFNVLHKWYFWGSIATVLPFVSLGLMLLKPKIW